MSSDFSSFLLSSPNPSIGTAAQNTQSLQSTFGNLNLANVLGLGRNVVDVTGVQNNINFIDLTKKDPVQPVSAPVISKKDFYRQYILSKDTALKVFLPDYYDNIKSYSKIIHCPNLILGHPDKNEVTWKCCYSMRPICLEFEVPNNISVELKDLNVMVDIGEDKSLFVKLKHNINNIIVEKNKKKYLHIFIPRQKFDCSTERASRKINTRANYVTRNVPFYDFKRLILDVKTDHCKTFRYETKVLFLADHAFEEKKPLTIFFENQEAIDSFFYKLNTLSSSRKLIEKEDIDTSADSSSENKAEALVQKKVIEFKMISDEKIVQVSRLFLTDFFENYLVNKLIESKGVWGFKFDDSMECRLLLLQLMELIQKCPLTNRSFVYNTIHKTFQFFQFYRDPEIMMPSCSIDEKQKQNNILEVIPINKTVYPEDELCFSFSRSMAESLFQIKKREYNQILSDPNFHFYSLSNKKLLEIPCYMISQNEGYSLNESACSMMMHISDQGFVQGCFKDVHDVAKKTLDDITGPKIHLEDDSAILTVEDIEKLMAQMNASNQVTFGILTEQNKKREGSIIVDGEPPLKKKRQAK